MFIKTRVFRQNWGDLMKIFNNILCTFLGHKADKHKHMLAYSIESCPMSYEVSIYDIVRCSRCGSVYKKSIVDKYHRYNWYTEIAIRQEEKRLRENIVSISEAYELLGKENKK